MKEIFKAIVAWIGTILCWIFDVVQHTDWARTAGFLTCIYTLLLIWGWLRKNVFNKGKNDRGN